MFSSLSTVGEDGLFALAKHPTSELLLTFVNTEFDIEAAILGDI